MSSINQLTEILHKELQPWRRFIIAIDGRDGSGKSPLGRRLALKLGAPLIETDLYLIPNKHELEYHIDCLKTVIDSRLNLDRPVIIEGVFLLRLLNKLTLKPDYLIYVKSDDFEGSLTWSEKFLAYENEFNPEHSNFLFNWSNSEI